SRVFDGGGAGAWDHASWTGDTPAGTSLALSVRSGDTPTPDGSWSAFAPLAGPGAIVGQTGRYLQYRAILGTSNAELTPALRDLTVHFTPVGTGAGAFTYTPDANFSGADSFTYRANDGHADSNVATVTITVNAVNDAPVAIDGTLNTNEDTPRTGTMTATDVDSAALTFAIKSGPLHGALTSFDPATGAYNY